MPSEPASAAEKEDGQAAAKSAGDVSADGATAEVKLDGQAAANAVGDFGADDAIADVDLVSTATGDVTAQASTAPTVASANVTATAADEPHPEARVEAPSNLADVQTNSVAPTATVPAVDAPGRGTREVGTPDVATVGDVQAGYAAKGKDAIAPMSPPVEPAGGAKRPHPQYKSRGGDASSTDSGHRPPASPKPFAATQLACTTPQEKATWASNSVASLSLVPNESGPLLKHHTLEESLKEKVLHTHPGFAGLGYSDVVLRDMVTATVREIVGTMEALLDRLLLEKKNDQIRNMVAELMTTDIASTIAAGRDHMKQQEWGQVNHELESLRINAQDSAQLWEERFRAIQDLQESQDDLWGNFNGRCTQMEARLVQIEHGFVVRTELDKHLKTISDDTQSMQQHICRVNNKAGDLVQQLADFEAYSKNSYATKAMLNVEKLELEGKVAATREEALQGLNKLRDEAAPKAFTEELQSKMEEGKKASEKSFFDAWQEINLVSTCLKKDQRFNQSTYATKLEVGEHVSTLQKAKDVLERRMDDAIAELEVKKATRQEVGDLQNSVSQRCAELEQRLATTSASLDDARSRLQTMEAKEETFATKDYAREVADLIAHKVTEECDEKELIAQLRREVEEERDRLHTLTRQVQAGRQDLSDTVEVFHHTRDSCISLADKHEKLSHQVCTIDGREADHWSNSSAALSKQRKDHEQLNEHFKALKEEFHSHSDFQRTENDNVKNYSTQRYLEQMDKAMSLEKSVQKVTLGHAELNDRVSNIKLPKVSS